MDITTIDQLSDVIVYSMHFFAFVFGILVGLHR